MWAKRPTDILAHFGNVERSSTVLLDGSSTTVDNVYSDDIGRWFLGRLIQSTISKGSKEGATPKSDKRVLGFSYDAVTGMLSAEVTDVGSPEAITKRYDRDSSGNIIRSNSSAKLVATRVNETDYDSLGRFAIAERLMGASLSFETDTDRDLLTGAPLEAGGP